jgi:hypothetical protein
MREAHVHPQPGNMLYLQFNCCANCGYIPHIKRPLYLPVSSSHIGLEGLEGTVSQLEVLMRWR